MFTRVVPGLLVSIALLAPSANVPAAEPAPAATPAPTPAPVAQILRQAELAMRNQNYPEAIKLITTVLERDPSDHRAFFLRARAYEESKQHDKAIADFTAGLKLNPKSTMAYQFRGAEYFRLGRFAEAVADFDKFIELAPEQAPHHWQRGIALYYAGRFEDGRKQFELHQTVNPYDVENAVWHFLCLVRTAGLEKARAALIPIERDARVPMMQIHALFGGKAKPEDVLAAAKAGDPGAEQLGNQLFYAHLYLGLYYEATGDQARTREHIHKAATDFQANHYMGDVARIHAAVLRRTQQK